MPEESVTAAALALDEPQEQQGADYVPRFCGRNIRHEAAGMVTRTPMASAS